MKNIYAHLLDMLEEKRRVALATTIETKGSTPQVAGASAMFSSQGLIRGTLGGGLLEADSQKRALGALRKRNSLLLAFGLASDISSEDGAICGGEVRILVDARPEESRDAFYRLSQSLSQRKKGVLATFISRISDEKASLLRCWIEEKEEPETSLGKHFSFLGKEIEKALSEGKPGLLRLREKIFPEKAEESLLFLEPVFPLPHLVIAGAGHVGRVLAHLGSLLNFEVAVIDDRPEFANRERLPDADRIIVDDFERTFQNFAVSSDTYLVIVTRGHKHDAAVLRQFIGSRAAYIGMIGSGRKVKLTRKKFLEEGWATAKQFDRVFAPIGLPIDSKTVEEIAVSIAAQLVLVRSRARDEMEVEG